MTNQVCGGTLALKASGAAVPPTVGAAVASAPPAVRAADVAAPPAVDPPAGGAEGTTAARLAVDWHVSMPRIFQSATLHHHARLSPFRVMCLYYEGRLLVSPSTQPGRRIAMKKVRYIDGALDALDTAILAA